MKSTEELLEIEMDNYFYNLGRVYLKQLEEPRGLFSAMLVLQTLGCSKREVYVNEGKYLYLCSVNNVLDSLIRALQE